MKPLTAIVKIAALLFLGASAVRAQDQAPPDGQASPSDQPFKALNRKPRPLPAPQTPAKRRRHSPVPVSLAPKPPNHACQVVKKEEAR
jgi:hypothetical protein